MKKEVLPDMYEKWTQLQLATELWHVAKEIQRLAEDLEVIANVLLKKNDGQ